MPEMKIGGEMMARPAKAISQASGKISKEEKEKRAIIENATAGGVDKIKPPKHLTREQKKIFRYITSEMEEAGVFGNLDVFMLGQAAICIDRLGKLDEQINENINLLLEPKVNTLQDKLFKQFARICNELSLSPQSRAKLAIKAVNDTEKKKTILDILAECDEE